MSMILNRPTIRAIPMLTALFYVCCSTSHADIATSQVPCSAEKMQLINAAMTKAKEGLLAAIKALEDSSTSSIDRYVLWFGAPSSTTVAGVKQTYSNALGYVTIAAYWCPTANSPELEWSINEVAAAYPGGAPTAIYFSPHFFDMNDDGSDSKAGTIVHELTHLSAVKGTGDHAYGVANAKTLAKNKPTDARNNADNYQYYMEDVIFGM